MRTLLFLFILIVLAGCKKDAVENPDCLKLQTGLLEQNEHLIKDEIEKLTADLHPKPQPEDVSGHMANLHILADRLNRNCSQIAFSVSCYACIKTYPPGSELLAEFEDAGETRSFIIILVTSDKDILRYGGIRIQ